MKLENQVVSLELAKKLKELGMKKESCFWWYDKQLYFRLDSSMLSISEQVLQKKSTFSDDIEWFSAFTVAELGEMLTSTNYNWQNAKYDYGDEKGEWFIVDYANKLPVQVAKTEADARVKMLIYLLENKLITPLTF